MVKYLRYQPLRQYFLSSLFKIASRLKNL